MTKPTPDPEKLVKTEAERVPPPESSPSRPHAPYHEQSQSGTLGRSHEYNQMLLQVKRLAEKAGGFDRLRELVDVAEQS